MRIETHDYNMTFKSIILTKETAVLIVSFFSIILVIFIGGNSFSCAILYVVLKIRYYMRIEEVTI